MIRKHIVIHNILFLAIFITIAHSILVESKVEIFLIERVYILEVFVADGYPIGQDTFIYGVFFWEEFRIFVVFLKFMLDLTLKLWIYTVF